MVVARSKFTLFTQDNSGSGLATVQNFISATRYDLEPIHDRHSERNNDLARSSGAKW